MLIILMHKYSVTTASVVQWVVDLFDPRGEPKFVPEFLCCQKLFVENSCQLEDWKSAVLYPVPSYLGKHVILCLASNPFSVVSHLVFDRNMRLRVCACVHTCALVFNAPMAGRCDWPTAVNFNWLK